MDRQIYNRQIDRYKDRQKTNLCLIKVRKSSKSLIKCKDRQIDRLRVVFHKKLKNGHFNSKNILSVKKRLGFITKVQGRVAGREHLLMNHSQSDAFGSEGSTYSPFHKTLPKSCLQMHQISARFYEMGDITEKVIPSPNLTERLQSVYIVQLYTNQIR